MNRTTLMVVVLAAAVVLVALAAATFGGAPEPVVVEIPEGAIPAAEAEARKVRGSAGAVGPAPTKGRGERAATNRDAGVMDRTVEAHD